MDAESSTPPPVDPLTPSEPSRIPPPPTSPPVSPHHSRAMPSGNDKIWAILSHISCLFGIWFILPLIVYLAMRNDSTYVGENAKEALNFHISLVIYVLCALPLIALLVGVPLLIAIGLGAFVLSIVAAIKASDGAVYRYPLTIRLIK
jgi:uncharacterized protein